MHDTLFIVLKTKHNLSIFEPEIKNPLSIFEPVGQNEYAYKKKTCILTSFYVFSHVILCVTLCNSEKSLFLLRGGLDRVAL